MTWPEISPDHNPSGKLGSKIMSLSSCFGYLSKYKTQVEYPDLYGGGPIRNMVLLIKLHLSTPADKSYSGNGENCCTTLFCSANRIFKLQSEYIRSCLTKILFFKGEIYAQKTYISVNNARKRFLPTPGKFECLDSDSFSSQLTHLSRIPCQQTGCTNWKTDQINI